MKTWDTERLDNLTEATQFIGNWGIGVQSTPEAPPSL